MPASPAFSVSDRWIASLWILGLVRALVAGLIAISALLFETQIQVGAISIGKSAFVDLIGLLALSAAAYKRHMWAAYGLIFLTIAELPVKLSGGLVAALGGVAWLAIFCIGSIHLWRSQRAERILKIEFGFVVRWSIIILAVAVISGFLQTFNPSIIAEVLGEPQSTTRIWTLRSASELTILVCLLVAGRRKLDWRLEHLLCIALAAWLLGGMADAAFLMLQGQPASMVLAGLSGSAIYMFPLPFIAWGLLQWGSKSTFRVSRVQI